MENNEEDIVTIKKIEKDNTITNVQVDWNKMPCKNCEWRYSMHCPHFDWCKKSNLCTY